MSQEVLLVLIPALIALGGTLLTLYITMWSQRKQKQHDKGRQFTADQQAAYKSLWSVLEEIHLQFRTDEAALEKYGSAVTLVNSFLIKNAVYLDDEDQTLSHAYLGALKKLTEIVKDYSDEIPQLVHGWASTSVFSMDMMKLFQEEERVVVEEMEATRKKILDKCRLILKST